MANTVLDLREERGFTLATELFDRVRNSEDGTGTLRQLIPYYAFVADNDEVDSLELAHPSVPVTWSLVDATLEKLCQRNLSEDGFYASLYGLFFEGELFGDDDERIVALFCALANARVPYIHFDLPEMPQERFDRYKRNLSRELRGLSQVAYRSFPQKTQEALAVLSIIDTCESQDEKAVALGMFLSLVREIA